MTTNTKIDVRIDPVLMPTNSGAEGGALEYAPDNITENTGLRLKLPGVWEEFLASEPDSLEEQEASRKLARIFIGSSAIQLMTSVKDRDTINTIEDWFTRQSIELYGTQDQVATREVMADDLQVFSLLSSSEDLEKLLKSYEELGVKAEDNESSRVEQVEKMSEADIEFRKIILKEFGFVLEYFDRDKTYSAIELTEIAKTVMVYMQVKDKRWEGWKVTAKKDGSMAVDTNLKQLKIGEKRAPSVGIEAAASLIHELVAHIQRSVNGESAGDADLQNGLSEYNEFEEGFGSYIEYLVTGYVPSKISNRQIAASLALGQLGEGNKYDRNEIYEILALRTKLLMQAKGSIDPVLLSAKEKELRTLVIDRFFRGGRGVEPVMPVYTRDVMYARGFETVRKYIESQIKRGVDIKELYEFLMLGKFDATRIDHLEKLKSRKLNVIAPE